MEKPPISIIIPTYNQGKYIEETIKSVLEQRIRGLQLIVIDGGSTDETKSVLEKYASNIDVCISEKDRGQTHALNKGLSHVKGAIVGWINSDDIYMPGALRKVLRVFERHPDVDVVHGDRLLLDAESRVLGWRCEGEFLPNEYGYAVASETAFWRAGVPIGGFDESLRFTMDVDWFSRMYVNGAKFRLIPDFLGGFRCHDEAKSSTMQDVCRAETERCWIKHFANDKYTVDTPPALLRTYSRLLTRPLMLTAPLLYQRLVRRALLRRSVSTMRQSD